MGTQAKDVPEVTPVENSTSALPAPTKAKEPQVEVPGAKPASAPAKESSVPNRNVSADTEQKLRDALAQLPQAKDRRSTPSSLAQADSENSRDPFGLFSPRGSSDSAADDLKFKTAAAALRKEESAGRRRLPSGGNRRLIERVIRESVRCIES